MVNKMIVIVVYLLYSNNSHFIVKENVFEVQSLNGQLLNRFMWKNILLQDNCSLKNSNKKTNNKWQPDTHHCDTNRYFIDNCFQYCFVVILIKFFLCIIRLSINKYTPIWMHKSSAFSHRSTISR